MIANIPVNACSMLHGYRQYPQTSPRQIDATSPKRVNFRRKGPWESNSVSLKPPVTEPGIRPIGDGPNPKGSPNRGALPCHMAAGREMIRFMSRDLEPAEISQLVALFNTGRHFELETQALIQLERYPNSGFAWKVLGISLQAQGKARALPALQKATALIPDDAEVHNNLGVALIGLGQAYGALTSCRRAVEIRPAFVEAYINQGNSLKDLGRLDDAAASYRRALRINPDCAEAHSNLGVALRGLGQLTSAVASLRQALAIKLDYAEAHSILGVAFQDLGQLDDAVANCRRAVAIKPDYAVAYGNLGNVLKDLGRLDIAVASYRRALVIKLDGAEVHNNLGNALKDLGQLDMALLSFGRALDIKPDYTDAHSNFLFIHNYLSDRPAAVLLAEAQRFGDMVARQARPFADWHNLPDPGRCLRVGFVSGDLRNHPVGYFVESVLAALASNAAGRLELCAYPNHFRADALTERIKACCHGWHSAVGLSDAALAGRIREDGIDILIDLSGHSAHNRLPMFAWKPAPVQVTWLGYFATTGVSGIDYLIADPWTLPEKEEVNFTEWIWRMPETRLCFTPPELAVEVSQLPAIGNGYVTFGCFNNLTKINDGVVALWAQLLAAVPNSRLLLKAKQLNEASARQSTVGRFAARGIVADRLSLEGFDPRAAYLNAYQRVDIALDPFPYAGGTTSVEALWMGVPVLTLAGERFLSRQGVGLLMNAGLPEWIAADSDEYVARAISHAGNLQQLATLRGGLRQQVLRSPIFDAPRFARHFEAALRGMWTQWCTQQQGSP
ncbi:MAG: tetratricopeptide repeat protein [Rhodocyclaceae bacterium]|nr:MAG: tetratricopeptide repeat protein [Rhodocyclaceae bacterium]